jgi:histidine triad (HIT) family protein
MKRIILAVRIDYEILCQWRALMTTVNNCILCKIARHEATAQILYEDEEIMAMLDLFPATKGHTLIIPKAHIATVYDMPIETGKKIMECAIRLCQSINNSLKPTGLNLIQANGESGGQTIDHFHLHIVPRYENDGVILKFGHGSQPADKNELTNTAAAIKRSL